MDWFENIRYGLRRDLVGRKFLYKSKYGGETIGEISGVHIEPAVYFDAVTTYNIHKYLSDVSIKVESPTHDKPTVNHKWGGYKLNFYIKSTNNITYNLDEIIILKTEIETT